MQITCVTNLKTHRPLLEIIQGRIAIDNEMMDEIAALKKALNPSIFENIPNRVKDIYATWGGTPFLDMNYTVYGKVTSGYAIIDKIQKVKRDKNDRPEEDVIIKKAYLLD